MTEVKKNVDYRSIIKKRCPSCRCPIPETDIENCNTCGVPFEEDKNV